MAYLHPQPPAPSKPPTLLELPTIEGSALVVPVNYTFPPICIASGTTDNLVPVRQTVTWHPPIVYLTILVNVLIYIVAALVTRKTSAHQVFQSQQARSRRTTWHAVNWAIFLSTFVFIGAAIGLEEPGYALGAIASLLVALLVYFTKVRLLFAERITPSSVRLRGIPRPVMEQIVAATSPG